VAQRFTAAIQIAIEGAALAAEVESEL